MDFSFDDQQLDFRSQFRAMLDRECTPADLRAVFDLVASSASRASRASSASSASRASPAGETPDRRRWDHMADMGVVGLTVPEAQGGLGLGMVDLVGLLEETGWAGLPEPLAETTAMVVPLLGDVAGEVARGWLQSIAAGETIATVGVLPEDGPASATVWADGADLLVVVSPRRVVAARASEVQITPIGSIDATRRLASVVVPDGVGSVLAVGAEAQAHLDRLHRRAALASAAVLLGAADRLIALACDHAKSRQQFGKPIGSFQAVKHLLATAYVRLEMARPAVYWAAASVDADVDSLETGRDCSMAKAVASEAALEAARVALQVHGAMGYTWEHDLHFWMKRVWMLAACWGDAASQFQSTLDAVVGAE